MENRKSLDSATESPGLVVTAAGGPLPDPAVGGGACDDSRERGLRAAGLRQRGRHHHATTPPLQPQRYESIISDHLLKYVLVGVISVSVLIDLSRPCLLPLCMRYCYRLSLAALFQGGLRPHMYCLPIIKHERHRQVHQRSLGPFP